MKTRKFPKNQLVKIDFRLFWLSLIGLIFISNFATLYFRKYIRSTSSHEDLISVAKNESTPLPFLRDGAEFPLISARGALVVDLKSGTSLYEKDPDTKYLPASTAKIVTALVAMDYYSPDEVLSVPGFRIEGQKMHLVKGEKIKVEDLLQGLLIYSANDAAEVLALNFPGGKTAFVTAMNNKIREFHLTNTYFSNPTGLDGDSQVTTARDLIRISEIAMGNPLFAEIVGTKESQIKSVDGKVVHKLVNINRLLGEVPGVLGIKTGWTENARENLVTYVERDGKDLIIVVLGSQDRFNETKELIDWVFENYHWQV